MKRFQFTLEKINDMKLNVQKGLKKSLEDIDKDIEREEQALLLLRQSLERSRREFRAECASGTNSSHLRLYDAYFRDTAGRIKARELSLEKLAARREDIRNQLVANRNELKVLEEKRNAQYAAYRSEVAASEDKEMDSFMSYRTSVS